MPGGTDSALNYCPHTQRNRGGSLNVVIPLCCGTPEKKIPPSRFWVVQEELVNQDFGGILETPSRGKPSSVCSRGVDVIVREGRISLKRLASF